MCIMRSYKLNKLTKLGKPTKPVNGLCSLVVYGFSEFRTSIVNNATLSRLQGVDTLKTD